MSVETPAGDTGTPDPSAMDEAGPDEDEAATAQSADESTDTAKDDGDDTLGEGGKAAIRAEREKARQAHEARKQAEAELEELRDELEELRTQAADAITLRSVLAHGLTLDDVALIGTGSPEEVDKRAQALADRIAASGPATLPPDPTQGNGTPPPAAPMTAAERFAEAVRTASRK